MGFDTNIRKYFKKIRDDQILFDVTLATDDGKHIQAHKIILSAGSSFFSDIFIKSNQTNMVIYLKGIKSVQLERLLDFMYNGEAFVGQEELKEFIEIGKDLQVRGFEDDFLCAGEKVQEKTAEFVKVEDENHENTLDDNLTSDTLEPTIENQFTEGTLVTTEEEKIQVDANSDLNLKIRQMIEKSGGVSKCKICGKSSPSYVSMRQHAESHIEGMSHPCHLCEKIFRKRPKK